MKIKKIHLLGYKRFKDLTIDLGESPKRIVALIGKNGCGKSSVFDGMVYVQKETSNFGKTRRRDYHYHSLDRNAGYNWENIEINFDKGTVIQVVQQKQKDGTQATMFSFRSPYRYNSDVKVKQTLSVTGIEKNDYGASSTADIDEKMENNYRRLLAAFQKKIREVDSFTEATQAIIDDLNRAIISCLDLKITDIGNVEGDKGTLYFTKSDYSGTEFEYNLLSSGEKEVVDLLLDIYLKREVFTDSIYIIDEPELHINSSIQRKLLVEIEKMVPGNCQIWIATHSIGFMRALQENYADISQVIHFDENNQWATQPYTLTPLQLSRASWLKIFDIALDDLTRLISPKRIIYCEGKDTPSPSGDERGLDANVYNTIFGETYNDTLFISSGGNTELDQRSEIAMKILNKVINNLEIIVLKDLDMISSGNTTLADRSTYLSVNPSNHRILKRREIENYLFDKQVLQAFCDNNNGLVFDECFYDSFVSDITLNNVKDELSKIKKSCGIATSMNGEVFKKNLAQYIKPGMPIYEELKNCIFL